MAPIVDPQPGVIKKLATIAGLTVTVTPSDARIEVDGQAVSASSSVTTEPGGKRKVKLVVSKSGYESQGFEVDLTAGETVPMTIELKAKSVIGGAGTKGRSKRGNIEMITIPAGNFTMGSNEGTDEKPIHEVFLDSYTISKNVITVAQFKTYCSDAGVDFKKFTAPAWGWIDDHPMVNVSWDEARAYCIWAGGDLPTEAQWEKAARGTDGRTYPWGNEFDASKLWSSVGETRKSTAPVGSFAPGASPFGCLDMAGNVYQWCLDYYDSNGYPKESNQRNPTGPGFGTSRVLRGGSWNFNYPVYFRSTNRYHFDPAIRINGFGFRLSGSS